MTVHPALFAQIAGSTVDESATEPVGVTRAVFGVPPPGCNKSRSCMVISAVLISTVSAQRCEEAKKIPVATIIALIDR